MPHLSTTDTVTTTSTTIKTTAGQISSPTLSSTSITQSSSSTDSHTSSMDHVIVPSISISKAMMDLAAHSPVSLAASIHSTLALSGHIGVSDQNPHLDHWVHDLSGTDGHSFV